MKVEIKERNLTAGNRGLYLEYYEKGFRKRENLHLYLIPDNAPNAKSTNSEVYKKAMEIRSDRILNPPSFITKRNNAVKDEDSETNKNMTWLQWVDDYLNWSESCNNSKKMMQHKTNVKARITAYLKSIKKKEVLLKDVDHKMIAGLFDFMRNKYRNKRQCKANGGKLADFTLVLFEETINAIFNKALREELISFNPMQGVEKKDKFHAPDTHREFLTVEELERFLAVETDSKNERTVQLAFGFSCMTGIRLGDVQRLRWSDIKITEDSRTVAIVQHKTGNPVSNPINDMAMSLLPPRPENDPDGLVYHLVKKSDNVAKYVRLIKDKAGIEKDLTFHCSRHTSATLAITAGADLYTVSKLLGHSSIVSTQVYAKVNMDKKIEAMNLVDGVFD